MTLHSRQARTPSASWPPHSPPGGSGDSGSSSPGGAFHPRSSLEPLRDVTGVTDETELDTRVRALYFPPFEPAYRRVGDVRAYLLPAGFERYAHEFRGRLLA